MITEDAEFDSVVSHVAYNIVLTRANLVQKVRGARGNLADWGCGDVRAADADGLVHEAHGCKCIRPGWVDGKVMAWLEMCSKMDFIFFGQ